MTRTVRHAVLLGLLATLNGGASCVGSDGGADADRGNPGGYGHDADPIPADRPHRIPRSADVVKDGAGKLRWRADLDGTVYVYDRDADVIRYTGPVRRGEELMVQPGDDRVSVDGRVVSGENLHRDAVHQIYFAADRARGGYDDGDRVDRPAGRDPDAPPGLPAGVDRLARGRDGVDLASAPRDGTVYLYNESTREVLARFPVRRGKSVSVSPKGGTVYVDRKAVQKVKFAKGSMLSLHLAGR